MTMTKIVAAAVLGLVFVAGGAMADEKAKDKAAKQAEIRKMAQETLSEVYKLDASLKGAVQKAPGYAVFSTYGLSFIIGGAGGKGLVHDNKTKKNTYMDLAQASAGLQIGAAETRYLFVFKDAANMQRFIDSGWEAGAEGGAGAKAGKTGGGGTAGGFTGGQVYSLTKNGFTAGGAVAGTKVWKDKELN